MTNQDPIAIPGDEQERKIQQVLAEIRMKLEQLQPREVTLEQALAEAFPRRSFFRRLKDSIRVGLRTAKAEYNSIVYTKE